VAAAALAPLGLRAFRTSPAEIRTDEDLLNRAGARRRKSISPRKPAAATEETKSIPLRRARSRNDCLFLAICVVAGGALA